MQSPIPAETRASLAATYRSALLDDVMPFWMRHSLDPEHGGYQSSLDREGNVIDSDKAIWVQGRMAWMFATLYNEIEPRAEWLDAARLGVEFLEKHAFAPDGKMFFLVTREGQPLRMRRHFFSESFAAVAYAAYAKATGSDFYAERARRVFDDYMGYAKGEKPLPPKWSDVRPMKSLAVRMIAMVTAQTLRGTIGTIGHPGAESAIDWATEEIRTHFAKPDLQAVMEVVGPQGEIYDTFDGRQLNPGHSLEAAWFILREAAHRKDASLRELGLQIIDWMWERGWDREYGGLRYFTDVHGKPSQEYWHDMKFWWPHNEAEIAALTAWDLTGEARFAERFRQVHDYQFSLFPDPEHGEWFGYFHRDGRRSSEVKGNQWKSAFHIPRMLLENYLLLTRPGR